METKGFKRTNIDVVEEVPWGMYVWRCPDGQVLGDDDGNVMNVFVMDPAHRPAARQALRDAARYWGQPEGEPEWWSGSRPIDDDQLAYQTERAAQGLTPDPFDLGAIRDEMRALKANEQRG